MMKKFLIPFLFLLSSIVIAGKSVKEVPTATLAVQSAQSVYQNGDKVQILGEGFPDEVEILSVMLSVEKTDGSNGYYLLKDTELQINYSGNLTGFVTLQEIKQNDRRGEILIFTKGANVKATNRFQVQGNLPPSGPNAVMGTFTFDEQSMNGVAELDEQLNVASSGTDWTAPVFGCVRREYNGGTFNAQVTLNASGLSINGSNELTGSTNNGSTTYTAGTDNIRLGVVDGTFSLSESSNSISTVDNSGIDHFLVVTENGQDEVAGTGFSITVFAHQASHLTATGYIGTHNLDWTTDATASPNGTTPTIPADGDYTFSAGVLTISGSAATLYNSAETPSITVSSAGINTNTGLGAGAGILVTEAATTAEVRIKTQNETADGDYDNFIYGDATFQGPTQGSESTNLFGVAYDAYGNLRADESGTWTVGSGTLDGTFILPAPLTTPNNIFLFTAGPNQGSTYSGTLRFDIGGGIMDETGTITVDDNDPATVTGFGVTTDSEDPRFVFITWSGTSSGDDDNTGTPVGYEIVWTDAANGPIDTEGEWNSATSLGSGPPFSSGLWHVDMSGYPAGFKFFAIRTFDDVGNISVQGSGSYTTSSDYSLPVDLVSFASKGAFDKVILEWETASEVNNEGFFIYRSSQSDDGYEQLNSVLIPGNGNSNTSHEYEYIDKNVVAGQTYFYKLISRDFNGDLTEYESIVSATVLVAPTTFSLAQNFPNPFNPETHFSFSIAEPSRASLRIYNSLGQAIRTIFQNKVFDVGVYDNYSWDATDDAGKQVANGIYYYELQIPEQNIRQVKKMLFLK